MCPEAVPYHLCFETLANELRIEILRLLIEKPCSVQELSQKLDAEQSRVSHALKMLRTCSFVVVEKRGKIRGNGAKDGQKKPLTDGETASIARGRCAQNAKFDPHSNKKPARSEL